MRPALDKVLRSAKRLLSVLFMAQAPVNGTTDREGHWIKVYDKQREGRGRGGSGMRMH